MPVSDLLEAELCRNRLSYSFDRTRLNYFERCNALESLNSEI
jgi:hypothetical protein